MRTYLKIGAVLILFVLVMILLVPIAIRNAMRPYTYISLDDVPQTEVAVVPGASVVGRRPSPILANRADIAIRLYLKGKVGKILVTGDDGEAYHDEVTPVRAYLLDAGIPARDIFLDHAGFDTYSSMYHTIKVFGARSGVIVTQDFHLPRALYIARHLGLDAYGVVANGQGGLINGYVREIPASAKALRDVFLYRKPPDRGATIDLHGDGRATWD